jgi:Kef-type K+ transport system membrane component KefB
VRRLFVVVALLAVMLFVLRFQTRVDTPESMITLAAIGFVVLATFAIADMGTRLSLPRVTGFIITGVVLGPSAANILSARVVEEMRMFNTLALGLIATSAGLELNLKALLPLFRTLGSTTALKVVLGVPAVGLVLMGMSLFVDLGVATRQQRMALAAIIGVLSIGTSPSIALAVLSETKARGKLADLILGAAVFKDLVVVVCLAIALALAGTLLDPGSAGDTSVLAHVIFELAGSLVAGVALGWILIAYVRLVQAEMLLFVAAMILVVAELCRVFHLELLLVFISAGFVVRNFSEYEHELAKPLELVALPVFVVFFTIAGAGINIATTWAILPAALAVCVTRAVVYWVSASFGNRIGGEPTNIKQNAWFAYLPQAGVTLGLVSLAAQKVPALHDQITTTGMAIVAINLLIGPVTLRLALARAGEIPTADSPQNGAATTKAALSLTTPALSPDAQSGAPLPSELSSHVNALSLLAQQGLSTLLESASHGQLEFTVDEEPSPSARAAVVRHYRSAAENWYEDWVNNLTTLPPKVVVAHSPETSRANPTDSRVLRLRLWLHRVAMVLFKSARMRVVPLRLAARMTLEPVVARIARQFYEASLVRCFHAEWTKDADNEALLNEWQAALARAFEQFAQLLQTANGPRRAKALRFSEVEPVIRDELAPLDEKRDEFYSARLAAIWASELAKFKSEALRVKLYDVLTQQVLEPVKHTVSHLDATFNQLANYLSALSEPLAPASTLRVSMARVAADTTQTRHDLADELARGFRSSVIMRELGSVFKTAVEELPTDLRCYQIQANTEDRAAGIIRRVDLRELADTHLVRRLLPTLDHSVRALSNTFAQGPRNIRDILEPLGADFNAGDATSIATVGEHVRRSLTELEALREALHSQVADNVNQQEQALKLTLQALEREILTVQPLVETTGHRIRRLVSRLGESLFLPWTTPGKTPPESQADARAVSYALQPWRHAGIPQTVVSWFAQRPVRDERIYSDRAQLLYRILEEEARWRRGERVAVLLRGELGSGKTSLLNMCELELRATQILRLDGEGMDQSGRLMTALARLLGCAETETAIVHTLLRAKPTLLVDNLPLWLSRANDPVRELERILTLMTKTPWVFWLIALDPNYQERLSKLTAVEAAFTVAVDIPPVTPLDLKQMVTSRVARARENISFRPTLLGGILAKLGLADDELIYFVVLRRYCRGNPGRALALALASATRTDDRLELDARKLPTMASGALSRLTSSQMAVLVCILEYGPLGIQALVDHVRGERTTVELDVAFLAAAGVLTRDDNEAYEAADNARWAAIDMLERYGAVAMKGQLGPTKLNIQRKVRYVLSWSLSLLVAAYLAASWLQAVPWYHWLSFCALLVIVFWPTLQNMVLGLLLRTSLVLREGAHLSTSSFRGTIQRVGFTQLELANDDEGITVIPYKALIATRLTQQSLARFGTRLRVNITREPSPELERIVRRVAYLCPYRIPLSSVVVRDEGHYVAVELYTWHRDGNEEVVRFLNLRIDDLLASRTKPVQSS